jgi:hypothetical protein
MSVTLYCHETPGLKLGPGTAAYNWDEDAREKSRSEEDNWFLQFVDGFVTIPELTPKIAAAIKHPGTPHIIVAEEGQVAVNAPGDTFPCPVCAETEKPRVFASQRALGGHLMSHRKK